MSVSCHIKIWRQIVQLQEIEFYLKLEVIGYIDFNLCMLIVGDPRPGLPNGNVTKVTLHDVNTMEYTKIVDAFNRDDNETSQINCQCGQKEGRGKENRVSYDSWCFLLIARSIIYLWLVASIDGSWILVTSASPSLILY